MKHLLDKGILICDLALVTIWMVFAVWFTGPLSIATIAAILPLAMLRLILSFGVYYRAGRIGWIVEVFAFLYLIILFTDIDICLSYVIMPFVKFASCIGNFITESGANSPQILESNINNLNTINLQPITIQVSSSIMGAMWSMLPTLWFVFVEYNGKRSLWAWKRVFGFLGIYGLCVATPLCISWILVDSVGDYALFVAYILVAFLVGSTVQRGIRLTKAEMSSALIIFTTVIAAMSGYYANEWVSLIVMVLCSCLIIHYLYVKWDGKRLKNRFLVYWLVLSANWLTWLMPYVEDTYKVWAVILIIVNSAFVLTVYYREKHNVGKSIMLVLVTMVLLPVLSLGCNPLACWGTVIIQDAHDIGWHGHGLFVVEGKEGVGLRDRYGYILPPRNYSIEYMGEDTPLFKVEADYHGYGVYDIQSKRFVSSKYCSSIEPRLNLKGEKQRIWEIQVFRNGEDVTEYLKYNGACELTNDPVIHALSKSEFPADYFQCQRIENPEAVDEFFGWALRLLWDKSDGESDSSHHWKWAHLLRLRIESLANDGVFSHDVWDIHDDAMGDIIVYTGQSYDKFSSDSAFRAHCYTYAVAFYYEMLYHNLLLAERFDNIDFKKEFQYYYDYISYNLKFWNKINTLPGQLDGDIDPSEYINLGNIWDGRKADLRQLLDAMDGDDVIIPQGKRPSLESIRKYFHESMPQEKIPAKHDWELEQYYPTDTIGMYLMRWVSYRDSIADEMSPEYQNIYRNQTTNLLLEAMP